MGVEPTIKQIMSRALKEYEEKYINENPLVKE